MEWMRTVAIVSVMFALPRTFAGQVYKCVDAKGAVAYQAATCPDRAKQSEVTIRKDFSRQQPKFPPPIGSAALSSPIAPTAPIPPALPAPPASASKPPQQKINAVHSYECRMSGGEVFYTHNHCPLSVFTGNHSVVSYDRFGNLAVTDASSNSSIEERAISRAEACRMINAHSAIGRLGHKHDEVPSTYDKNSGRDPCR